MKTVGYALITLGAVALVRMASHRTTEPCRICPHCGYNTAVRFAYTNGNCGDCWYRCVSPWCGRLSLGPASKASGLSAARHRRAA